MITANEPEKNDQRATRGLDPDRVDDRCEVVEVPVPGKRSVIVSLRSVVPLTEREQRLLGELVEIVAAHEERDNPHGGVVTELMLAWNAGRGWIKDGPTRDRLGAAIRSAAEVIRAAGADRDSRFRWAEEAARLAGELDAERLAHAGTQGERDAARAELALAAAEAEDARNGGMEIVLELAEARAELAGLRERAVILPNDWQSQLDGVIEPGDLVGQPDVVALIESWRPAESAPSGWPCKCGTDETDMVHTAERCYSAVEPVPQALVEAAAAAQESARLADAIGTEPARTEGICPEHGEHYSMCHGPYGCTPEFGTPNSPERKAKVAEAFKDKPQGEWWK